MNANECSICLECIEGDKNQVITDCGHCFHTNCLMKNVIHNGFGCPYCRTVMAVEPANSDSDSGSEWSEEEDEQQYGNDSLNGIRWLFQRVEGENMDEIENTSIPTANYISQKLSEQGCTMEHLLKIILVDYEGYDRYDDFANEAVENISQIIDGYQRNLNNPNVVLHADPEAEIVA
jgi:hypothetical protein